MKFTNSNMYFSKQTFLVFFAVRTLQITAFILNWNESKIKNTDIACKKKEKVRRLMSSASRCEQVPIYAVAFFFTRVWKKTKEETNVTTV